MCVLYHYPASPFSRRTRLALAHKERTVDLRDARADAAVEAEAQRLWPTRTLPVLVEPGGVVLGESGGITRYLDAAYGTAPRLYPVGRDDAQRAAKVMALVDAALDGIVNLGTRYFDLKHDPHWPAVQDSLLGRAQACLDALGHLVTERGPQPIANEGWSVADMWLVTAVLWLEGIPARAATAKLAAQMASLPWSIPAPLLRWVEPWRGRADVRALG